MSAYSLAVLIVSAVAVYLLWSRRRRRRIEGHLRKIGFASVKGAGISPAEAELVYPLSRTTAKESCFSNGVHAVYWVDWPLASTGGSVRYTVYQAGWAGNALLEARHRLINKSSSGGWLVHPNAPWLSISERSGCLGSALAGDAESIHLLAKWDGSVYIHGNGFYFVSC